MGRPRDLPSPWFPWEPEGGNVYSTSIEDLTGVVLYYEPGVGADLWVDGEEFASVDPRQLRAFAADVVASLDFAARALPYIADYADRRVPGWHDKYERIRRV